MKIKTYNHELLEQETDKRYKVKDKRKKQTMKVSGSKLKNLQKILKDKS